MIDYSLNDLRDAYKKVGIDKGRVIYITGNFGLIGRFEKKSKKEVLSTHLSIIRELIGSEGTIVVPTHSWTICNTKIPFDLVNTPSETGIFTEFIRKLPESIRQFHPFSSSTALGADANYICSNNPRHAYGPNSPFSRMIEADAIHVSVGMPVQRTISLVHHIELIMGVPYRYTKEFIHPCHVDDDLVELEFYLYVLRKELNIKRDQNVKIMHHYANKYSLVRHSLGRSYIQSVNFIDLYNSTINLLSKDIYAWLESPPAKRDTYQK